MGRPFSYEAKRVILTGAHSGMGAATVRLLAKLGAEVHALDIADVDGPVASFVHTDVGDPGAIDAALARIGEPVHALFNCAGIPQTFPALDVLRVNFLGLRHLTERVLDILPEGGAIAHVASLAGMGWEQRLDTIRELLETPDFATGLRWCEARVGELGDPYFFSKECVIVYTLMRSRAAIRHGVRMNCISPGPVDSPMMAAFKAALGSASIDWTAHEANGRMGRPDEMAGPLAFLNSDEASYVSGHNFVVDAGFSAAMTTGQVDLSTLSS